MSSRGWQLQAMLALVSSLSGTASIAAGVNLLRNPSFERWHDGAEPAEWSKGSYPFAWYRDDSRVLIGQYSMRVEGADRYAPIQQVVPGREDADYVLSWHQNPGARTDLRYEWNAHMLDDQRVALDSVYAQGALVPGWQRLEATFHTVPLTAFIRVVVRVLASGPPFDPHTTWLDGIQLEEGTSATPYDDSACPSDVWSGKV